MKNQSLLAFEVSLRFLHPSFRARGQHCQLDLLQDARFDFTAEEGTIAIGKKAFAVLVESFFQHQAQRKIAGVVTG